MKTLVLMLRKAVTLVPAVLLSAQTTTPPRSTQELMEEWLKSRQVKEGSEPSKPEAVKSEPGLPRSEGRAKPPTVPVSPSLDVDLATRAKYQEALREYYAYYVAGMQIRKLVFGWQLFSSKIIFAVVLLLVTTGMYFAAVQFHVGLRRLKRGKEIQEATELAASLSGVKVTSPVLGVVILVISFAFFYLYLSFVYPISNTF